MLTFWKISGISHYFNASLLLCTWHAPVFTKLLCKYTLFYLLSCQMLPVISHLYKSFCLKINSSHGGIWCVDMFNGRKKCIKCTQDDFFFTCTWHFSWTFYLIMKWREWIAHCLHIIYSTNPIPQRRQENCIWNDDMTIQKRVWFYLGVLIHNCKN